jgi:hypothetical protein
VDDAPGIGFPQESNMVADPTIVEQRASQQTDERHRAR